MNRKEPIDNILYAAANGIKNAAMAVEDKNLLLKDLCARLPYGVMCLVNTHTEKLDEICPSDYAAGFGFQSFDIEEVRPYLRSMSSMTEAEETEFQEINLFELPFSVNGLDWLNEHHFDYRGLIEKGLALEAPKNMYQ